MGMMYDFPATPTEGQEFTPVGGPTYIYHAPAWYLSLTSGSSGVSVAWADITGKPATFPPTVPIDWADISGEPATFPPTLPIPSSGVTGLDAAQSAQDAAITTKVGEAPTDGASYGRKNSAWEVIVHPPTAWADITGKPTTFPPTLPIATSDVTGLDAAQAAQDTAIASKLNTSAYTPADVLAKLLTVDGATSGLDADLLDGNSGTFYTAWANLTGVPSTFPPSTHTHAYADITGKPSTFPPSAHNHTASEVTDFSEAVDDRINGLLVAGTNITLSYNDTANTMTISASGGGGGIEEAPIDGQQYARSDAAWEVVVGGSSNADTLDGHDTPYFLDRTNHTGTQSADTVVDGTTNHVFTAADDTKLAGIATGATANDTDANLKARANHTGTQTASTISDFNTAADARVAAAVGVSVQAFDADLTSWAGIAPSAKLDTSAYTASDVLAKLLTVDGSASGLDADKLDGEQGPYYLSRANHTGTQTLSTISDAKTGAAVNIHIGTTAPGSPAVNDLWVDTT